MQDNPFGNTRDYADGRINISGENYSWGLPAEPVNAGFETPAQYTFDLDGLQAVRLKTVIGGDYPLGDEAERRITFGVRIDAAQVRYLTVIEPFEKENSVQSVFAPSADRLIVTLKAVKIDNSIAGFFRNGRGGRCTCRKDGRMERRCAVA